MKTSQAGIELIKKFEGLRLSAYLDSVDVPTIGVGHTRGVKMGDVITEEQAEKLLRDDLADAEEAIRQFVAVPLTQGQYDSLVSWTFNLGRGALLGSTLLKKLNKGLYEQAANEMLRWVHAGGKLLPGLVKRRQAEKRMFLDGPPAGFVG